MITNAMSIDVEDYFQVSAFDQFITRDQWESMECRVEQNISQILLLLSDHKIKATFFVLGWIAKKYPSMIRMISEQGHEIGSHGMNHRRVYSMSRSEFEDDITDSKKILEDITNSQVIGFRAPSFSIDDRCDWAFQCLLDVGYKYSSSIYPIKHDHYGDPMAERFIHEKIPGFFEIPISTYRLANRNYPSSGGGYFRFLPYAVSKWLFSNINQIDRQPVVFYFHPWEIDPDQPVIKSLSKKAAFRHYLNLDKTKVKLSRAMNDFGWDRMDKVFLNNGSVVA